MNTFSRLVAFVLVTSIFIVRESTGAARPAGAPSSEDVVFSSGAVQLAGTLTIPDGDGRSDRRPAIVLLGGSGPAPRAGVAAYARQLADLGLVTLAFDKRGSGESTGDWTDASLDDLADDATAAMRFVAARPEVETARVGVWGVSQAGWVVPLLASRSPSPAFSIVVTGGGMRPRDIEMYGYRQALERGSVSAEDRAKAEALLDRYFRWLGTGVGRADLVRAIDEARTQPWFRFVPIDRVLPSDAGRPKWAWVSTFDPADSIARMRTPLLVILGAGDPLGPAGQSAEGWRAAIARGGNKDASVLVFDDMGHAGRQGQGHDASAAISPDYTSAVQQFIARYVR